VLVPELALAWVQDRPVEASNSISKDMINSKVMISKDTISREDTISKNTTSKGTITRKAQCLAIRITMAHLLFLLNITLRQAQ
jgi:hypothetical protein